MSKIMGQKDQEALVKKYAKYVSTPKMEFFAKLDLDVIQGKREGIYIETLAGKGGTEPLKLIDCRTSGGVFNFGHRHPRILEALKNGIEEGLDIGDHHLLSEHRANLAEQLAYLLPGDISKTQFCATGGEAVDLAIKLARGYTRRKRIVSATVAYHGVTGLSMAAGAKKFKEAFMWEPEDFVQVPFGDLEAMEQILDDSVAAVMLETIPATGGILIAEEGYFARIRELCNEHGIIMIADEVQTGLGRTGSLWGIYGGLYPEEEIVPDIIVLAKGMSAGIYPMATCSYRPFLEQVFEVDPFLHISTTGGSELGCHITSVMLSLVSEADFLANVRARGVQFEKALQKFKATFPFIAKIRGRGLMWGIEFVDPRLGMLYTKKMIEHGIFADYCGNHEQTVKIMPPLIISEEQLDEVLQRLEKALKSMAQELM